jgi:predicted phage terminase large subunit-like protein
VWKALDNPSTRWAVIAPTFGDVRDVCAEGESGLINIIRQYGALDYYNRSTGDIKLQNGSRIKLFSADEPDRLRGPQHHGAWMEELASWRYPQTFDQAQFGLRLGIHPQTIITTTPRPIKIIRSLVARDDGSVKVTRGSTFDNAKNLAPQALIELQLRYAGTRMGRQELYGEILDDTEGALWTRQMIEDARVDKLPAMTRIVVAIDPAVTSGEDSDQTGITVAGRTPDGHYYVMKSIGLRISPDAWARRAIELYHEFDADRIVAEKNNGGDMIEVLLKQVDPTVPVKLVTATRGKRLRAEPVSSLYEQGRVHHLQSADLEALEDQMVAWTPESTDSPDLLDSMVWAISELSVASAAMQYLASRVDFCPSCRMPVPKGCKVCPKCQTIMEA